MGWLILAYGITVGLIGLVCGLALDAFEAWIKEKFGG